MSSSSKWMEMRKGYTEVGDSDSGRQMPYAVRSLFYADPGS